MQLKFWSCEKLFTAVMYLLKKIPPYTFESVCCVPVRQCNNPSVVLQWVSVRTLILIHDPELIASKPHVLTKRCKYLDCKDIRMYQHGREEEDFKIITNAKLENRLYKKKVLLLLLFMWLFSFSKICKSNLTKLLQFVFFLWISFLFMFFSTLQFFCSAEQICIYLFFANNFTIWL